MPVDHRQTAAETFLLDIAGVPAGTLAGFSGFDLEADVAEFRDGSDPGLVRKQVTAVRWTPARASVGIPTGKPLADWIEASVSQPGTRRDGELVVTDPNLKVRSRLVFSDAMLTGITVPRLDGSSREAGRFELTWESDRVTWTKDGGTTQRPPAPRQKTWLTSNFRLEIDGMPCDRVASIDSFSWTCSTTAVASGSGAGTTRVVGQVTVPDLTLTISNADLPAWSDAARSWFVDGQHGDGQERGGRILLLSADMATTLAEIKLGHVGFKRFVRRAPGASAEAAGRFLVELYVEMMTFAIAS